MSLPHLIPTGRRPDGAYRPSPLAQPLTGRMCAIALVASARAYGLDPIAALASPPHSAARKPRVGAILAVCAATDMPLELIAAVFDTHMRTVQNAERRDSPRLDRAHEAACLALGVDGQIEHLVTAEDELLHLIPAFDARVAIIGGHDGQAA